MLLWLELGHPARTALYGLHGYLSSLEYLLSLGYLFPSDSSLLDTGSGVGGIWRLYF